MKRFFCFLVVLVICLSVSIPVFAATDSGMLHGSYVFDPSTLVVPDDIATNSGVSGALLTNADFTVEYMGNTYSGYSFTCTDTEFSVMYRDPSNHIITIWTKSNGFVLDGPLTITFNEPLQIDLTGTSSYGLQRVFVWKWFRAAKWLSAPEPFPDAITSALSAVLASFGGIIAAITNVNGTLVALLPLIGISVALSIALLVFVLTKRSAKF